MILGIESSCDESALALLDPAKGVVSEWVHSQIACHADYGGVVPDLAVRQHLENFFPLLDLVKSEYSLPGEVNRIAVTCGPGLIGCLGVGLSLAKTLGNLWGVPVCGVNHLRGHAFSPFMQFGDDDAVWQEHLPHLGLLVSGGNTLLFEIAQDRKITVIGKTMDDAAGEALDKGAKLLGLPYPGGVQMEKFAKDGNPESFHFPQYKSSREELAFSFSGLKTSLLYTLKKMSEAEVKEQFSHICASYQAAAMSQLVAQTKLVLQYGKYQSLGLSGGVANNQTLRNLFDELAQNYKIPLLAAERKHTGDNAAMIAYAALVDPENTWLDQDGGLNVNPGLRMNDVPQ